MSDTPIVFVVDDDISVRESLESLIRCEGWQPETFASAQASSKRHNWTMVLACHYDEDAPSMWSLPSLAASSGVLPC
jgi:DNA-binding NtrC family response regulator